MGHFSRPKNQQEYEDNFSQIKPLMNPTMAFYESARCLFCYDAPCIKACPTSIDIPLFIKQINTGNIRGAAKTIYSQNYLGNTCGKVCPTEVLCEGACVYNEQDVKPIEIGRLQNFASNQAIIEDMDLFKVAEQRGKKVAIIGAGPAGISCACELSSLGYDVEIFEASNSIGGLALHGTAPYKIRNEEVKDEITYLQSKFGFTIHFNARISEVDQVKELEQKFEAIFIGAGLGNTREINLAGENLQNCIGATEFIESFKSKPLETHIGKNVVVIGGGNTAMDAASESARMGAREVRLLYRRAKSNLKAYEFEFDLAQSVGVICSFEVQPIEVLGDDSVSGLKCVKTRIIDGKLTPVEGSEFVISCDMVIKATGQEKQINLYELLGIDFDTKGKL